MPSHKRRRRKLDKVQGYVRCFGRYVSKAYLFAAALALLAVGFLYALVLHPFLMDQWYSRQILPEFYLDSPRLTNYTGRARLLLQDDTLLYEGKIDKTIIQGEGRLYDKGCLLYEGEFEDSKFTGEGVLYYPDGTTLYKGGFRGNLYEGAGELYTPDGRTEYAGDFSAGLYHGKGTLTFEEDYRTYTYTGGFVEGRRTGEGKLSVGDSVVYEGMFLDGLFHGEGQFYERGTLLYAGGFAKGLYEGTGRQWMGIRRYEGGFSQGLFEGMGKLYDSGVLLYEGEFSQGLYNGMGIEYNILTGHRVFEGRYLQGVRMTAGAFYDANGNPVTPVPQALDPLTLLGVSYEDACRELAAAGVKFRSVPPMSGFSLLVDDAGGVVYQLSLAQEDGGPADVEAVYLCALHATHSMVVGADISSVTLVPAKWLKPGEITSTPETFALTLSNLFWKRDLALSAVAGGAYKIENYAVTAYYAPNEDDSTCETVEEEAQEDIPVILAEEQAAEGFLVLSEPDAPATAAPVPQQEENKQQEKNPPAPKGTILFLRVTRERGQK